LWCRSKLPVFQFRHEIIDVVKKNDIVVILGETGSGKTTQIAQFLADGGLVGKGKRVAVSQPRRVGAIAACERVAKERQARVGKEVGYSIRFENNSCEDTIIKYMTDGVLLQECLNDRSLSQYDVVILDEAHERSVHTDVLFALLKNSAVQRDSLKLLITSATLDSDKFSAYFDDCPVLRVPGRSFPVDIKHYKLPATKTWKEAAIDTCMRLHLKQAAGHILLFMTGQDEIDEAVEELHKRVQGLSAAEAKGVMDLMILPCYGALPQHQQQAIFDQAPDDCRKLIVATNIAETSLTIDGVRYVVDPGYVKQKQFNPESSMDALLVVPISRSAAKQRAGRAGRTAAGMCVRIYDEKHMEDNMGEETIPEIQRTNLTHTVLSLKGMGIEDVLEFNYMDPPPREMLEQALLQLYHIGALHSDGRISSLGKEMLDLPIDPPMARALLEAVDEGCAKEALTVVSLMAAENVFYRPSREDLRVEADAARLLLTDTCSDHLTLLNVYNAWLDNGRNPQWCRRHYVDQRALSRARKIRDQLEGVIGKKIRDKRWESETKRKEAVLKAITAGYFTHAARLMPSGAYRVMGTEMQLVYVHPSSALKERGSFPAWVMYHELLCTSKAYMRQVSTIEHKWVEKKLKRMKEASLSKLSGHRRREEEVAAMPMAHGWGQTEEVNQEKRNDDSSVNAARERFLARKKKKK